MYHGNNVTGNVLKKSISTVPYKRTVWRIMEKFHTAASVVSGVQQVWPES